MGCQSRRQAARLLVPTSSSRLYRIFIFRCTVFTAQAVVSVLGTLERSDGAIVGCESNIGSLPVAIGSLPVASHAIPAYWRGAGATTSRVLGRLWGDHLLQLGLSPARNDSAALLLGSLPVRTGTYFLC